MKPVDIGKANNVFAPDGNARLKGRDDGAGRDGPFDPGEVASGNRRADKERQSVDPMTLSGRIFAAHRNGKGERL